MEEKLEETSEARICIVGGMCKRIIGEFIIRHVAR